MFKSTTSSTSPSKLESLDKVLVVELGVCGVRSCLSNSKSCPMKFKFGFTLGFLCFTKS